MAVGGGLIEIYPMSAPSAAMGDEEKDSSAKLLFRQAAFAGVEILVWCFTSNHFIPALRGGLCS